MTKLPHEQLRSSEATHMANVISPSPSDRVTTASCVPHHVVAFRVLAFLAFALALFYGIDALVRVTLAALDRDLQLLISAAFSGAISLSSLVVLSLCIVSGSER
jgi:ABC-type multidrug transport system permease subunit